MFPNIAKELVINGITLSKLAELTGIAKTTLYDKYKGRSVFTLPEAYKIKDALKSKMTIEELFWIPEAEAET